MTAATPGGRPPHQQELLMKKKKHSSHRRERPQGRKVKQYPRHQASLSLLLPYLQPGKGQQIPPQEHPLQQTNKHRHSNLANCVYNSLHRSFYSHQHKPEPTTVTRCSLPMTAATSGGRPTHQQELLTTTKKHSPHRRERLQRTKVKQYPRHQASLSLLLPMPNQTNGNKSSLTHTTTTNNMPTVHYMKRSFFSKHGLPLPQTHHIAMKQAHKENTSAYAQAATRTTGKTTAPAQKIIYTDIQTSVAPRIARPQPPIIKRTSPDGRPAGTKNSPSATTRRFISFLQPT